MDQKPLKRLMCEELPCRVCSYKKTHPIHAQTARGLEFPKKRIGHEWQPIQATDFASALSRYHGAQSDSEQTSPPPTRVSGESKP